ncbi:MAG: hypothetical protein GVY30_10905 [Chloroflexi bacterium]|jgi:phosphohistidine swiveling domain-containing protein|nr:hypothetical protein [Chloroflexota bacterium]
MTEWLLSGQNTQESMQVARPMTVTTAESQLNKEISWFIEQIAGDTSDFDQAMRPTAVIQDWVYLNISYFVHNVGSVMPFDPTSLGAPAGMIEETPTIPLKRKLGLPQRFYKVYQRAVDFYKNQLPDLDQELREIYWTLREATTTPRDLIWSIFEPEFYRRCTWAGRAHIVVSMTVTGLDSTLHEQVPELVPLFAGNATTTSMMGQRIWQLREIAATCGSLVRERLEQGVTDLDAYEDLPEAQPLVEGVRRFLKDYGHRGFSRELDYEAERLADRPEHILLAIASQLREEQSPKQRAALARQEAETALQKMFFPKRIIWQRVLKWGQQLLSWREESKSNVSLKQAIYGLAAQHLSRYFYPQDPDDIMLFYTLDEFLDFSRSHGENKVKKEALDRRRSEFKLHLTQTPPPELVWYDPETEHWRPAIESAAEEIEEAPDRYQGIPASAGSGPVEGLAVVTNDPVEAGRRLLELDEDVILVTRLTDPAWSSLFARLSGVVTELGGVISHASIVARENGLPAVVGVAGITTWVRNGQRLRVDGATGEVEVLA